MSTDVVFTDEEKESIRAELGYKEKWQPKTKEEVDNVGFKEKLLKFKKSEAKKQWEAIEKQCDNALKWIKDRYHPAMERWYLGNKVSGKKSLDLPHVRVGTRTVNGRFSIEDREKLAQYLSDNLPQEKLDELGLTFELTVKSKDRFVLFYDWVEKQFKKNGEILPGLKRSSSEERFYVS